MGELVSRLLANDLDESVHLVAVQSLEAWNSFASPLGYRQAFKRKLTMANAANAQAGNFT